MLGHYSFPEANEKVQSLVKHLLTISGQGDYADLDKLPMVC